LFFVIIIIFLIAKVLKIEVTSTRWRAPSKQRETFIKIITELATIKSSKKIKVAQSMLKQLAVHAKLGIFFRAFFPAGYNRFFLHVSYAMQTPRVSHPCPLYLL